jgi:hypothetical protein
MPCVELVKWIINHIDAQKCRIFNDKVECNGSFLPEDVSTYNKFLEPDESSLRIF